jgi:hypothetical protein
MKHSIPVSYLVEVVSSSQLPSLSISQNDNPGLAGDNESQSRTRSIEYRIGKLPFDG